MKIHWENIRWETDAVGTSWATIADEDHNSLTLENRDGRIAFYTDGTPRFEIGAILDITALFAILSRNALADLVDQGHAEAAADRGTSVVVPGQRQAPLTEHQDIGSCQAG
jgi:hypothetical protein